VRRTRSPTSSKGKRALPSISTSASPTTSCSIRRGTIERVKQAYEEQLEAEGDDGSQASLGGEGALASIEWVSDDLQEKVDQFGEREDVLHERFQDAMA
jgi:hypothetical protein